MTDHSPESYIRGAQDAIRAENLDDALAHLDKALAGLGSANDRLDIFDLFRLVEAHPDYVFGTIFVPGDFPNDDVPEDFPASRGKDALAERGNEFIQDTVEEYEG